MSPLTPIIFLHAAATDVQDREPTCAYILARVKVRCLSKTRRMNLSAFLVPSLRPTGLADIEHTFKPFNVQAMESFNLVKNLCAGCITPSRLRWSRECVLEEDFETEMCINGALC